MTSSHQSSPDVQAMRDASGAYCSPPPDMQASCASPAALPGFCLGWCESKRYQVQEVIGKGSYGVVFAAIDTTTGARVAIKKIQGVFDNVADATRILREIKLLRLLKHPGGRGGGVARGCFGSF